MSSYRLPSVATLDKQLTEAMIPMLNAAGFRARLLTPEWATLYERAKEPSLFYYMGRGSVSERCISTSTPARRRASATPIPNLMLLDKEQQEFDPKRRREYLSQAMSILTEDAPACFMWRHKLLGLHNRVDTSRCRTRIYAIDMHETLMLRLE